MSNNSDLAIEKIDKVPTVSGNTKALFLVVVEDPTVKTKTRYYLSNRVDRTEMTVEIVGFETTIDNSTIAQLKSAKTYNEACEIAKMDASEHLILPWQKIIRIRKFTFSTK